MSGIVKRLYVYTKIKYYLLFKCKMFDRDEKLKYKYENRNFWSKRYYVDIVSYNNSRLSNIGKIHCPFLVKYKKIT